LADNGGSTKTYEYWWHRKTVPDPGERILVDTITEYKGIREIYQQSETTTWYYDYAKYLSINIKRENSRSSSGRISWRVRQTVPIVQFGTVTRKKAPILSMG
jgi:hypothetical protein